MTADKVFCMMPWIHLHLWPNGQAFPCCVSRSDMPLGNTNFQSIADIWNGPSLRGLRQDMLAGRPNKACERCYQLESTGTTTLRQSSMTQFGHHMPLVDGTAEDGSVTRINMAYLDIRWSNICNLRCRTCSHTLSSAWYDDQRAMDPGYDMRRVLSLNAGDSVWDQILPYLNTVEEVYFAGGESLVTDEHYRLLDHWLSIGHTGVRLRYTTNFTALDYKQRDIFQLWTLFDDVRVAASLDASHARGEYLRKNMSWAQVCDNRRRMMIACPNVYFEITPTVSMFNIMHLPSFHRDWVESGLLGIDNVRLNPLTHPDHTSITVLPPCGKAKAEIIIGQHLSWLRLHGAAQSTCDAWHGIIAMMRSRDDQRLLPEFSSYHDRLDAVRGEDWRTVFPELWEICHGS